MTCTTRIAGLPLIVGLCFQVLGGLCLAVDRDFAFQGEFVTDWKSPYDPGRTGLQVIALGEGQFEAIVLPGGLPGAGWNRRQQYKLNGSLDSATGAVILRGPTHGASLTAERAFVRDRFGRIAELRRIMRVSPTLGAAPSRCALKLFGASFDPQRHCLAESSLDAEGWLKPGFATAMNVRDFHLHVEFRTPYMPEARGQGRGNSGVYIQRRYEVQILDSFGLAGQANECAGLYKQRPPDVNMCLPPLSWQTYDIDFQAARWNVAGAKIANARITVLHNGVKVHDNVAVPAKTGGGKMESPAPLPILFQDHDNPVAFRNLWIEFR